MKLKPAKIISKFSVKLNHYDLLQLNSFPVPRCRKRFKLSKNEDLNVYKQIVRADKTTPLEKKFSV